MKGKTDALLKKAGWFLTRIWVWLPVTLGVLIVIGLILLPFAIRQGAERWLTDQGAEQVRIEDIDFNLFIGRLTLRNLQFRTDGKRSIGPKNAPHGEPGRIIGGTEQHRSHRCGLGGYISRTD